MAAGSLLSAAWRLNRVVPSALVLLLLVNLAIFYANTWHLAPRLESLESRYIRAQAQAREVRQAGDQAGAALQAFRQGLEDVRRFRQAIPPREELTSLISELFSLAAEAGLDINQVRYQPKDLPSQKLRSYELNFAVEGSYLQVKRFVHGLEQSPRLISLDNISLSGGEGEPGALVNLQLRLSTYFQSDGQ